MSAGDVLDGIVGADKAVTHRAARHRRTPMARLAGVASEVADQPQLISLSLATLAVGAFIGRRDLVRGGARMLVAELVATAAKAAIKKMVDRSRPAHALDTGDDRFRGGDSNKHQLNSFPSGHTAGAVAVSRAAAREIDGVALPAGLAAAAIAAAQAPSGHHYVSDVAAGAVIGWLSEKLVDVAVDAIDRRWTDASAG